MAERNEYMKAAVDEMEKINADEEMRYRYLMREKREHDEATIRQSERELGIEQGIEQGIKLGIGQGVIQGTTDSILELLEDLGDIPDQLRNIISAQQDLQILKKWHKLAAKADSLEEFEHSLQKS